MASLVGGEQAAHEAEAPVRFHGEVPHSSRWSLGVVEEPGRTAQRKEGG